MGSTPVGISGSRGAAILGLSKYKTPLEAWLEIMEERIPGFCNGNGFMKPERIDPWVEPLDPKTAPLRWGLAMENPICQLVDGITNREKLFIHPKYDFITCHIDGQKNNINQENKTAFEMAYKMSWGEPGSAMIPEMYQVQIQAQMLLSDTVMSDVNVLVFPRPPAEWEKMGFKIDGKNILKDGKYRNTLQEWAWQIGDLGYFHRFHCPANPAAQKAMLKRYLYFWNKNVLKETPPPVKGYDDIKWLIASPEGEIEATPEIKEQWQEYIDIGDEIESMIERKDEIKNNFAIWTQKEIESKKVKPGNEKRKLNVYAGRRKLFSISRPAPGIKVSRATVTAIKEDAPELYEKIKKISFADILGDIDLTEKQGLKGFEIDTNIQYEAMRTATGELKKFLKSLKLTKLLSRDNIMKQIKISKPELYKTFFEHGLIENTEPVSRLSINKPKE